MFSKVDRASKGGTSEELNGDAAIHASSEIRIIVAYNSTSEFLVERTAIWGDVIPEIQATALQFGIDIEFSDYLVSDGGGEQKLNNKHVKNILDAVREPNVILLCMVGDLYGDHDLPLTLRKEEFESIRSAVFEQSQDVKFLNEYYVTDRTVQPEGYRLVQRDIKADALNKLVKIIQSGAKSAFDDGVINQANPGRQKNFFNSPLHNLITGIRTIPYISARSAFALRKFETLQPPLAEANEQKAKSIADLKNEISASLPTIAFPLPGDGASFLTSKGLDKYKDNFTRQITEKLKEVLHQFIVKTPPTLPFKTINESENSIHTSYAEKRIAEPFATTKKMDSRLEKLVGMTAPGMYLIQGPTECGKTTIICRLWEMIGKKKADAIRVIRFAGLTYSCMYAHEIWYHICVSVCYTLGVDPSPILPHFHLSEILQVFASLIEPTNKLVYVFIDDLHSVKMGRLLCPIERKGRKIPSNMVVFATALNVASVPNLFAVASTVNLDSPTEAEILDVLKKQVPSDRRVTSEHWGVVKQQLTTEGRSYTLGRAIVEEIMLEGDHAVSGGLLGRLGRVEKRLGEMPVGSVCRALVNSRNGITRTELMDFLSCYDSLRKSLGSAPCFPPRILDDIIAAFGSLLSHDYVDDRVILRPASITFLAAMRARYSGEKVAVCQGLAECLLRDSSSSSEPSLSPRPLISYTPFPRTLKRDNGTSDLRIVRQLWYYLLHTGNMDALKEDTLCNFDFIDVTIRSCGVAHLLTMYEDTLLQVLHHDIQVLAEQVLLPALATIVRDPEQTAAEVIGRLRYTRAENSHFLNTMVEEAMGWVDAYGPSCLLVPLSCWVAPPEMSLVLTFDFKDWKNPRLILVPTFNHQHILVTGNENAVGEIYMVHIASQFVLATYKGHTGAVTSICESSEGDFFTSTSIDKTVRIWLRNDASSRVLRPHTAKILCSVLSSDNSFLVTGSADSSAKVIDMETGQVLKSFPEHTGSVVSLQLTSNNEFLITGSGDFSVQMWSLRKGVIIIRMGGLMAPVTCVAITSNDAFVAVACEDETLRVFGTVSGQELHDMSGHEGKINALVAAHDDCQLFAATVSRIFCYDIHTGQIVLIWDTEVASPVSSLQITRDNFFLISGCGSAVHVWNIRERIHDGVDSSMEAEGHVTAVALSHDEKMAACGTWAGIVALWDLDIAQCVCTVVHAKRVEVTTLAFSNDNSIVFSGNSAGNISLIETNHGRIIRSLNPHNSEVRYISTIEGKRGISCDKAGVLKLWDVYEEDEEAEVKIDGVLAPLHVIQSSPSLLVVSHVVNNPKELRIWTIEAPSLVIKSKLQHNDVISAFSVAPHGTLLVTASADQSLKIWTIDSGYLTQVLVGHEGAVTCCAMAEDERLVVSGASDKKVIIWSVSTGDVVHSLCAQSPVTAVAITADASVAFSADETGWLETWSCDTGLLLSSFNSHRPIQALLRSFDAMRLLLKVPGCAQLPILCLHNTPAGHAIRNERKRSARNSSITSLNNSTGNVSDKKDSLGGPSDNGNGQKSGPPKPVAPRPTFDKLERSKSRLSITMEKEKSSVGMVSAGGGPTITKSKACVIL